MQEKSDHQARERYAPAPTDEQSDGFDPRSLLLFARRHKGVILGATLLGTLLAGAYGMQQEPLYTASAQVVLEPKQTDAFGVSSFSESVDPSSTALETQLNILRSEELALKLVDQFGLADQVDLAEALEDKSWLKTALAGLTEWLPKDLLVASGLARELTLLSTDDEETLRRQIASEELREWLAVRQQGRSMVFTISYTSPSPYIAARIANGYANIYVDAQREAKLSETRRAVVFFEARLAELEEQLRQSEEVVESFRVDANIGPGGAGSLTEQQMAEISTALIATRAEISEKEARLRYIHTLEERGENLASLDEVMSSPLVNMLMQQQLQLARLEAELMSSFGEKHPRVVNLRADKESIEQQIEEEVDRVIDGLSNNIRMLKTREKLMEQALAELRSQNSQAGRAEITLRQLEREAEAIRRLYESFLDRHKQAREELQIVESDARIISRAKVPSVPSSRSPEFFALLGFVGSAAAGLGLAFVRERLDNGIRSGKEVEQEFGIPCLGLVPFLKKGAFRGKTAPHLYLADKPLSTYAEAIRSIFAALRLSNVDEPPRVIQITSSAPNEGKTTFALSLATLIAKSGASTILVDLDMRHPSVLRELGVEREKGIIEFMAGDVQLSDAIFRAGHAPLDVLGTSRRAVDPGALLSSTRMQRLFEQLREQYDFVIVDSTPTLGVSDSKVTTGLVDSLMFIIRWDKTNRESAEDALKELYMVHAPIGGVVISQVDIDKHANYGYGGIDKYYYEYKKYYTN